jgi:hypothetical protein
MINKCSIIQYLAVCVVILFFTLSGFRSPAISIKEYLPATDTSSFTPNTTQGWSKMSLYLNQQTTDSADFEIILMRNAGMQGTSELFAGTITNPAFIPVSEQQIIYHLLIGNTWNIRITTSGQCYIRQTEGSYVP